MVSCWPDGEMEAGEEALTELTAGDGGTAAARSRTAMHLLAMPTVDVCVFVFSTCSSMTSSWIRVQRDVPLCTSFSSVCAWSHVCDVVRQGYPAAVYFPAHAGYISKRTFFSSWSILGFLRMLFMPLGLCACFLVQKLHVRVFLCVSKHEMRSLFTYERVWAYACVSLYICVCVSVHIHMHIACKQI